MAQEHDLKYMVSILHSNDKHPPSTVRSQYRETFNISKSGTDPNIKMNSMDVSTEAFELIVVVREYCGTHDAAYQTENAGGPLPEDRPGRPRYSRSYSVVQVDCLLEKTQRYRSLATSNSTKLQSVRSP